MTWIWLIVVVLILASCDETWEPSTTAEPIIETTETRVEPPKETEKLTAEGEAEEETETVTQEVIPVKVPLVFRVDEIDETIAESMIGKSFHQNDHIGLKDLRYVQVGYFGYDGQEHQGALVVHTAIAADVMAIFRELYDQRYPIEQITPVDAYEGDDDASMVANNTSAFNYRVVEGTTKLSNHAYGLAIDVNPLVNPWVTNNGIYPPEGAAYADRSLDQPGLIVRGDACYEAFTSRGFRWGGDWQNSKDYQHFDMTIEGIND